jgi:hypothetical protein
MASTFKLDITGRFVVEDDGSPHPTIWTRTEAAERMGRLEAQAAAYEREADVFARQGREIDAGVSRSLASHHLTLAADLLAILQGAEQREAA